jgi:hypothetical protein
MAHRQAKPKYRALCVSGVLSLALLAAGMGLVSDLTGEMVIRRLAWPLCRLLGFIGLGLVVGQVIEASGWTRFLGAAAAPAFRFGNLGRRCSAAFTTAFFSGAAANAMLLEFYKEEKISRRQLVLTNLVNQLPAYFLHLPTTFFIVISLTGRAGILYFLLTLAATLVRTLLFLLYGHWSPGGMNGDGADGAPPPDRKNLKGLWRAVREKFPARAVNIAAYVMPIYIFIFMINAMGFFDLTRQWLSGYVVTTFIPVEALSMVILSFAAEFTSGFAAAGALLDAGVITTKQTVLALLIGNVIAFPVRALRHQLPRYIGIFSPRLGTQLLLLGQGFRVASLVLVGGVYYLVF